jgi:hypothetical protein
MAIIDELDENDSQSQVEFSNITETDKAADVKATETAPEEVKDDVPEKYKGKSVAEIARMHEEAEKLIGRQANEVGELRKLTDEILKQQLAAAQPKQEEQAPEVDFWSDPDTYLNKKLENHPDIVQAKEVQRQIRQQSIQQQMEKNHPGYLEIVQSPDFYEWAHASKVRSSLFNAANIDYDFDAASELVSTYKLLKGKQVENNKVQAEQLKDNRGKQLKAATVDAGGGNEVSRKVYRRADLIRLRMQDPARYEALADEIMLAYQEGRVK